MSPGLLRMSVTGRFFVMVALPLLILSVSVSIVTSIGLKKNSSLFTQRLKVQAMANDLYSFVLEQENASKAILIDEKQLDYYSEVKIEAYEKHLETLKKIKSQSNDPLIKDYLQQLSQIEEHQMRPIDTKILETTFDDIYAARDMYFREYRPIHAQYAELIKKLKKRGDELVKQGEAEKNAKNYFSIASIITTLCIGNILIWLVIFILARRVELSQHNMRELLNGLPQGVFYFDKEGNIPKERSSTLNKILPGSLECNNILNLFNKFSDFDQEKIKYAFELLFENNDDFSVDLDTILTMVPASIKVSLENEHRLVAVEYRQLKNDKGKVDKVLVVTQDISEQVQNQMKAAAEAERVRKITKAATNVQAFVGFKNEMIRMIKDLNEISGSDINWPQYKRIVHTLKGTCGTFEFRSLAKRIHDFEEMIPLAIQKNDFNILSASWEAIKDHWKFDVSDIEKVLRIQGGKEKLYVTKEGYNRLQEFSRTQHSEHLEYLVSELIRQPIDEAFEKYKSYIQDLSDTSEEKNVTMSFTQDSSTLSFDDLNQIDTALIHILRNCFDHGIEAKSEREKIGKTVSGCIDIAAYRLKDRSLHYVIKDDGNGIDGDKLAAKAEAQGIWSKEKAAKASYDDKVKLIFCSGLSVKDEVTEMSGRGVGMEAVLAHINSLGGKLTVHSVPGQGSQFEIDIPAVNEDEASLSKSPSLGKIA